MKSTDLFEAMRLPEAAKVERRVFKKYFLESNDITLTTADRRVLTEDLDSVTWQYALRSDTVALRPFVDEAREYLEVAVLEVHLTARKNATRIADIMHRAIPYPVVLVLSEGDGFALSVAHKRLSRAEKDAIVADPALHGPWLDGTLREHEHAFVASLVWSGLAQAHAFDLYTSIAARVLALVCAGVSGRFVVGDVPEELRRERLGKARGLEREVVHVRAEIHAVTAIERAFSSEAHVAKLQKETAAWLTRQLQQ